MPFCAATTIKGNRCKRHVCKDRSTCGVHSGDCTICLSELRTGGGTSVFPCGHIFHKECIDTWFSYDNRCPCCRTELRKPLVVDYTQCPLEPSTLTNLLRACWEQGKLGPVRHVRLIFDSDTVYILNLLTNDLICQLPL